MASLVAAGLLVAAGTVALAVTKVGTSGGDVIAGTDKPDAMWGEDGNDQLIGKGGNDYLESGPGSDKLDGGAGNDLAIAGTGNDTLLLGPGNDVTYAGPGNDQVLVVIRADSGAPYRTVRGLLDDARAAGAKRLALATRQKVDRAR